MTKKEQCLDFLDSFINEPLCKNKTQNLIIIFKIKKVINYDNPIIDNMIFNTLNGCEDILNFINEFNDDLIRSNMKYYLNANIDIEESTIVDILVEGDKEYIEQIKNIPRYVFEESKESMSNTLEETINDSNNVGLENLNQYF